MVIIRSGVLPSWLGWAGLVVAAAELVGAASVQAGANGLLLWLLATSVIMLRHPSPASGMRQVTVGAEPRPSS